MTGYGRPLRAVPSIVLTDWPAWPEIPRYSHSISHRSTPNYQVMQMSKHCISFEVVASSLGDARGKLGVQYGCVEVGVLRRGLCGIPGWCVQGVKRRERRVRYFKPNNTYKLLRVNHNLCCLS